MNERRRKVHMMEDRDDTYALCGMAPDHDHQTYTADRATCRVCQFHYLASCAAWARAFLDDLRGVTRVGTESPPRRTTEQMNGPVESPCGGRVGSLSEQGGPQEGVSEVLSVPPTSGGIVQPIVDDGRAATLSVRVKEWQVAKDSRDARKVCDETLRNGQLPIGFIHPDE